MTTLAAPLGTPGNPQQVSDHGLKSLYDAATVALAVRGGYQKLAPFREVRRYAMSEFAGPYYGIANTPNENGYTLPDNAKRPINLLSQFVLTNLPNLVGAEIRTKCNPRRMGLLGEAHVRGLMIDHVIDHIDLARTHRLIVMDALLGGLGIYKCGVTESGRRMEFNSELFDPGQFYAARVDLDDFSRDPQSRDPLEDSFRACRYRQSKQYLLSSGMFTEEQVDSFVPITRGGTMKGQTEFLSGDSNWNLYNIHDLVEFWHVVMYDGNTVLEGVMRSPDVGGYWVVEPKEYQGPERGPYELLSLIDMPNNAQPVSPAMQIMDLHRAMAAVGVKVTNSILRRTRRIAVPDEDVGTQILEGGDDEVIITRDANGVKAIDVGGIMSDLVGGTEWLQNEVNNATANIQQQSGTEGGADTATESTYLQNNAQRRLADMRDRCNEALRRVVRHCAWWIDNDPTAMQTFIHRLPNGSNIEVVYDAQAKEGDFTDFSFDIQPFFDGPNDPNAKLMRFTQGMTALIQALPPVAQLGGDVQKLVSIYAEKFDCPELDEVFPTQFGMMQAQVQGQLGQPGQAVQVQGGGYGGRPIDAVRSGLAPTVPNQGGAV